MEKLKYFGIDLGTSNSAIAVFEGGKAKSVLNTRGDINTPSVVRVTKKGIIVGAKAKKHLHTDAGNTFKEFKRLMGTSTLTQADCNGHSWSAEGLSSEVIKALKSIAEEQEKCVFDKVVITVPALFELPQSRATADAARMAGFDQVELLPEPVASGLAAGWSDDQMGKAWLVYDLGGGTFDVSLLESRDGLLRVVAHDGDNFLGGRDIDRAVVTWVIEQLHQEYQFILDDKHVDYAATLRQIQAVVETTKIRLSSTVHSMIELEFEYDNNEYEFDIELSREQLELLSCPVILRSIDICKRLLKTQGLPLEMLSKVVLVGGPSHMPVIKNQIEKQLASVAKTDADPMSLVSQGASIYAATINLGCTASLVKDNQTQRYSVWLQYPSVCTELTPMIMGRIIDHDCKPHSVKLVNNNSSWQSELTAIDDGDIFMIEAPVKPHSNNSFELLAFNQHQQVMPFPHPAINIVHGLAMSDPPLSRSIGLALADGSVRTFIERGTPLPAKRTFVQSIVDTLVPGSASKLDIPIVQGERKQSRFCRRVGSIVIDSCDLKNTLSVGAPVEVTIEVDRGGDLRAYAVLADQGVVIEGVAQLIILGATPAAIITSSQNLNTQIALCLQTAFRERNERNLAVLNPLSIQIQSILKELPSIENDVDACQRLSRNLMEIEAELDILESNDRLGDLIEECENSYYQTLALVNEYGDLTDKRVLNDCAKQLERSLSTTRIEELERLIERLEQLHLSAHRKSPNFWKDVFLSWASLASVATNPKRANEIVENGHLAIKSGNTDSLKALTEELYDLIPQHHKSKGGQVSYDSGIY